MNDLRYGLRRLSQAPLFTLFSVATLALGIGVTTAAYSVVYSFVLRDLGVRDREGLFTIDQNLAHFSPPEYQDLVSQQTVFASVCAYTWFPSALTGRHSAELISAEAVTGNFFQTLGVDAELGRMLQGGDDRPDAPAVAVLSSDAWRSQFDADPNIVGTTIRMAGRVFEVVGVAPASLRGASRMGQVQQSLWIPLSQSPGRGKTPRLDLSDREYRTLNFMARLAPGHTEAEAVSQIETIGGRLEAVSPVARRPGETRHVRVYPAFEEMTYSGGQMKPRGSASGRMQAIVMLSIPALVLLVACTNLMNLVLSRGVARQHEFAVRRALGASRWRMVREQLADGTVVAIAGGFLGVLAAKGLLAFVNASILETFGSSPLFRFTSHLEPAVLALAVGAAILSLVVSSLLPAVQLTKARGNRLAADATMSGHTRWRSQANLIAVQVAVSVALFLVTALGVTLLTTGRKTAAQTGLDHIAQVNVPLDVQQRDEARGRATIDRIIEIARQTPGVEGVEISTMNQRDTLASVTSPARPFVKARNEGERIWITTVTPGALRMLGMTLRFGRAFDARDSAGATPAVVINAGLARKLLGRDDVIGQEVLVRFDSGPDRGSDPRLFTIVGITGDTYDSGGRVNHELYVPYQQHYDENVSFLARASSRDEVGTLVTVLRHAVRRADPDVAISFAGRADIAKRSQASAVMGMMTTAMGSLATAALVLAMAGLFGVLSHVVAKRTRELGLRMALGADRARIMRMILKDGFRPVIEGLTVGLAGAVVIRLMLQPTLEKTITAFDPIAFALAAGPLLVAAAIACYLPARRAAKVEPNVALRDQ